MFGREKVVAYFFLQFTTTLAVFVSKEEASQFLRRFPRSNKGNIFEEFTPGNLERECIEEVCTYEEAFEVFDDRDQADVVWQQFTEQCKWNQCNSDHTARCESVWNAYICHCEDGYTGPYCDMDIDECQDTASVCVNGDCENLEGSYNCHCLPGWMEQDCSLDINECEAGDACNGGECTNTQGSFDCKCLPGWTGHDCSQNIDECAFGYCPEGSTCVDGINSFTCICPDEGCP
jgi:hypothetical protein